MLFQIVFRGPERRPAGYPLNAVQQRRDGAGNHVLGEAKGDPPVGTANIAEITADGPGLGGKGIDEFLLVLHGIGRGGEVDARVDETVVGIRQAVPCQFAVREVVEIRAQLTAWSDLPDVVHPDVPGSTIAAERVCLSTRFSVLLQHENPFARDPSQQLGGAQAAYSRSDDDGIVHSCSQFT